MQGTLEHPSPIAGLEARYAFDRRTTHKALGREAIQLRSGRLVIRLGMRLIILDQTTNEILDWMDVSHPADLLATLHDWEQL